MLVGLGVLFYASYGFTNRLAGTRDHVPSIVFDWEGRVPFYTWTILPYWTTNLFYAGSLFLCADRAELSVHVRRLLATQLVAVACFALWPLKVTWAKPDTAGAFGFLFDSLGAFDKPFNQAPSLHVALTVVLGALYLRHLPRRWVAPYLAWSVLVVASTLTTFQHHFIDLPTGALLGFAVVWSWPMTGAGPLAGARRTTAPDRLRLAATYALAAVVFAGLAVGFGGGWLWLFWPAVSLALVAAAYGGLGVAVFEKDAGGRIGVAARVLLAPYLVSARLNSRLWTRTDARRVEIADGVFLGRFPAAGDLVGLATVVDLTAEFSRPAGRVAWQALPMLDLVAPEPSLLAAAAERVEAARAQGPVLICCALGYGRSVAVAAVWLTRFGGAATLDEALALLRHRRPRLVLKPEQIRALEAARHD